VQRGDRICQFLDPDVGKIFLETLQKQGINFLCNTEIKDAVVTKNKGMWLNLKDRLSGSNYVEQSDVLLVSIGRSPNTKGLNLEAAGVPTDRRGTIQTKDFWRCEEQPHIYAVGDCAPGTMLVHKAEMEAIAAVDCIVGKPGKVNYDCIPGVIYTSPEVAWVGQSEEDLIKNNIPYNKGIFHINKNLRARITHEDKGLVKVMTCPTTHKFLGIWIISNNAGEMIAEGAAAYHNGHTV